MLSYSRSIMSRRMVPRVSLQIISGSGPGRSMSLGRQGSTGDRLVNHLFPTMESGPRPSSIFPCSDSLEATTAATYTMVELGASYAPWSCLAATVAGRLGKRVTIRAVEASLYFHTLDIADNFAANGLSVGNCAGNADIAAIHGAVGIRKGSIFFPVVTSAFENGGQAATSAPDKDYTGRAVAHEEVPVCTLDEIFKGLEVVDFLHCDIQGSEREVLVHGASQISQRVRRMFIGTHSRKIEGDLIECYHKHGWRLVRERPVTFDYRADLSSVVGMTTRDGGQYWVNGRF